MYQYVEKARSYAHSLSLKLPKKLNKCFKQYLKKFERNFQMYYNNETIHKRKRTEIDETFPLEILISNITEYFNAIKINLIFPLFGHSVNTSRLMFYTDNDLLRRKLFESWSKYMKETQKDKCFHKKFLFKRLSDSLGSQNQKDNFSHAKYHGYQGEQKPYGYVASKVYDEEHINKLIDNKSSFLNNNEIHKQFYFHSSIPLRNLGYNLQTIARYKSHSF